MKRAKTISMKIRGMAKKEFLLSIFIFFIGLIVLIFELVCQWFPSLLDQNLFRMF